MPVDDLYPGNSHGTGSLDEFEILQLDDLAAYESARRGPEGGNHCHMHGIGVALQCKGDGSDKQVERDGIKHTHQP